MTELLKTEVSPRGEKNQNESLFQMITRTLFIFTLYCDTLATQVREYSFTSDCFRLHLMRAENNKVTQVITVTTSVPDRAHSENLTY